MDFLGKALVGILAAAITMAVTSLILTPFFPLHDLGACLGLVFWLGPPVFVLSRTNAIWDAIEAKAGAPFLRRLTLIINASAVFAMIPLLGFLAVLVRLGPQKSMLLLTANWIPVAAVTLVWILIGGYVGELKAVRDRTSRTRNNKPAVAFRRTSIPFPAPGWDEKTCPECGSSDLLILDRHSSSQATTRTATEEAIIRGRDGDEIGSMEFEREVAATRYESRESYACGFCLEKWTLTTSRTR